MAVLSDGEEAVRLVVQLGVGERDATAAERLDRHRLGARENGNRFTGFAARECRSDLLDQSLRIAREANCAETEGNGQQRLELIAEDKAGR